MQKHIENKEIYKQYGNTQKYIETNRQIQTIIVHIDKYRNIQKNIQNVKVYRKYGNVQKPVETNYNHIETYRNLPFCLQKM